MKQSDTPSILAIFATAIVIGIMVWLTADAIDKEAAIEEAKISQHISGR